MNNLVFILQQVIICSIPLLIVALAGVFAERSGIINIALDGIMIFGSFVGAMFAKTMLESNVASGSWLFILSMLVAAAAGAAFSLLLSFSAINLKADQTIGGTALNMLAPALVCSISLVLFNQEKVVMPAKGTGYVIHNDSLPAVLRIFFDKAYISTFVVIALFVLLSLWLYKTKTGLRMRSCGEHPQAAASVGINVYKMRYLGTTISGALAGLGGYVYAATTSAGTAEATVAGTGFLALAIMIFGNWKPIGIVLGALMFGLLKCLGVLSSQISFLKGLGMPMYFYNMIPYIVVLIVLGFTAKKSGCPKAEGIPYEKGQR